MRRYFDIELLGYFEGGKRKAEVGRGLQPAGWQGGSKAEPWGVIS